MAALIGGAFAVINAPMLGLRSRSATWRLQAGGATAVAAAVFACACPAARADEAAAYAGYSLVAERLETVYAGRSFNQHWLVRVYISSQGRIFTKQSFESGNPQNGSGSTSMISTDENPSQTPFTWNGSGVSRAWTNPRSGVNLRMSLTIVPGGGGPACRLELERQNLTDATIRVLKQSCRMFRGNAVAD